MGKDTKPKNIRATEEVHDRFAQLAEENFPNQGSALEAFMNAWEIQNAKNAVPERETEISDFDSHIQALQRAYIHSLDVAQNANARARDDFRRKLEALETEKEELRNRLNLSNSNTDYYKEQKEAAEKTAKEAQANAEAATKHAATLETALDDKQKLIDQLTRQVEQLTGRAERAEDKARKADNEIEDLKAEIKTGVNKVHNLTKELTETQTAAEVAAAKAKAEQAEAVANAERTAQKELAEIQREAAETMKDLYEQINRLTERAATAEARATATNKPDKPEKKTTPKKTTKTAPMNDQQTPPTPKKEE